VSAELSPLERCTAELQEARARLAEQASEIAILKDAVETAYDFIDQDSHEPWYPDDDMSAGAARATLRLLAESLGQNAPRLLRERPEGQKFYGLLWRELRAELAALQDRLKALTPDEARG
jgi:hypothetical protein